MDVNRLSQGQMIAAVSAIALFIISFLPWFGSVEVITTVGSIGGDQNMWESENPLDVYLLIVILVALLPAAMTLLSGATNVTEAPFATALLAGVGTLLIFYQLFDHIGSVKIGLILGLLACGAIAVGGYLSMQEDAGGERY